MTENKPIMIDGVDVSGCDYFCFTKKQECYANDNDCNKSPNCYFKQLTSKTQEYGELREYHNKCCGEFENEKKEFLEKYNQLSRDFYSGKYCNVEKCKQLYQLKAENEQLKKQIESDKGLITNAGKQNYQLMQEYDRLKVENEQYKEEIMLLRKGYDEEDCTKTCPNMQVYERELNQAEQKLEKIRGIAKDFHYAIIPFHRGINHEIADRIDYYLNQMLHIIDEVE